MADETATTPENTESAQGQTVSPDNQGKNVQTAPATSSPTPKPGAATPKPHIPSPAALAKKTPLVAAPVQQSAYSEDDVNAAKTFGRVDDQGNVFVSENGTERVVGQFPNTQGTEALDLYAHRYLDLKAKFDLFETRLKSSEIKAHEIDESLKSLKEDSTEPQVVGDIPALQSALESLQQEAAEKKQALTAARKEAMSKAIAERTVIVEKAETLAASLSDSTNWRSTADKFRSLFDQWQQHQRTSVRIDKNEADGLWKRFSSARTEFNQARRKWAQNRDAEQSQAKQSKEAIIKEAEALQGSTDWGATSHDFNALMDRWKQAGRAGRNEDDALWARFRAAADTFFNARQADRDEMSSTEKDNLVKKEALLVKAEALLPVKDEESAKQARQSLAKIQEEWDLIGYVPREDVHRIESRLDKVDKQIKSVEDAAWKQSDPEADARKSSFEVQLTSQLSDLTAQIEAESDPKKRKALEAEKAAKEQWLKVIK
jgi:hypothetical protein